MRGHSHFNRASPFGHDAFESHLEEFVGAQRSPCEHYTIVKIIGSTAKKIGELKFIKIFCRKQQCSLGPQRCPPALGDGGVSTTNVVEG